MSFELVKPGNNVTITNLKTNRIFSGLCTAVRRSRFGFNHVHVFDSSSQVRKSFPMLKDFFQCSIINDKRFKRAKAYWSYKASHLKIQSRLKS